MEDMEGARYGWAMALAAGLLVLVVWIAIRNMMPQKTERRKVVMVDPKRAS
jgi:hypothetical protein